MIFFPSLSLGWALPAKMNWMGRAGLDMSRFQAVVVLE